MGKIRMAALLGVTLVITACAQADQGEDTVPADTATMGPAPAPMPMDTMQMDSATHDTMQHSTTTTQ